MKYKGILVDIDNTLYAYDPAHKVAMEAVISHCRNTYGVLPDLFTDAFGKARKKIHEQLAETAASHNRLLYFQRTLELLQLNPLEGALELYELYWNTFMEHMVVFDGVYELFEQYRNHICLVTDLTADIQHKKVHKLGLHTYTKHMVTSEEAGREKPHASMFTEALAKLGLNADDVCMIGDSFPKDIAGASALGIRAIWLNPSGKTETYNHAAVSEVQSFKQMLSLL